MGVRFLNNEIFMSYWEHHITALEETIMRGMVMKRSGNTDLQYIPSCLLQTAIVTNAY